MQKNAETEPKQYSVDHQVIVVVDPDNWILKDIRPWVDKVKPGQALAQKAWFSGSREKITKLWHEFCRKNCDWHLDLAAVPYLVHRDEFGCTSKIFGPTNQTHFMFGCLVRAGCTLVAGIGQIS